MDIIKELEQEQIKALDKKIPFFREQRTEALGKFHAIRICMRG